MASADFGRDDGGVAGEKSSGNCPERAEYSCRIGKEFARVCMTLRVSAVVPDDLIDAFPVSTMAQDEIFETSTPKPGGTWRAIRWVRPTA
jgi:hypothetical protein